MCVLSAAVLGTLAEKQALLARLKPHGIGPSWNQVGLPGQPWHPEAVTDISRLECEVDWPRHAVIAGWYMQLVGRDDSDVPAVILIVDVLPPPLMADDGHVERL